MAGPVGYVGIKGQGERLGRWGGFVCVSAGQEGHWKFLSCMRRARLWGHPVSKRRDDRSQVGH